MTDSIWRDACVGFPKWTGRAQLGLDDQWTILGIDIGGGGIERGYHQLRVVAARDSDLPKDEHDADLSVEIPVTEFVVHDVDPYEVLAKITHQFELRLRRRGWGEHPLRVTGGEDLPVQGS